MIVCNTSPIFYLHKLGHLDLMRELFSEVSIPEAVVTELDDGRRLGYGAPDVREYSWLKIHQVKVSPELSALGIGAGETEAIALALENTVKFILLDDGEARTAAFARKLPVVGTVGILAACVEQEFLPKLGPVLTDLVTAGFRLGDSVRNRVLKDIGEL